MKKPQDIREINFPVDGRMIRLADIATVTRGFADPPQPMFRVNGDEAIGLGIAAYAPISVQRLGDIALRFETGAVIFWTVLLLVFGLLSSLFSARRVLQIDPVSATTGAGVNR